VEATRGRYYTLTSLVYYDASGPSLKAKPIAPGEVVRAELSLSYAMLDTNVVRLRIATDRQGLPGGAGQYLPLVAESDYDNNDFTLTMSQP
jgi:hypothetical protein